MASLMVFSARVSSKPGAPGAAYLPGTQGDFGDLKICFSQTSVLHGLIGYRYYIAVKGSSIFQHIIKALTRIGPVEKLTGKKAVFIIFARTYRRLPVKFRGRAGIRGVVGTAGLKSPELVEARIDYKGSTGTYAGIVHINCIARIGQRTVQGKIQIKVESETNFL